MLASPAHLGYLGLAAVVGVESAGVPLPGETALIAAAVLANGGGLQIELVIAVAALAAIIGDNVGYLIGRRGGRALVLGRGPWKARREVLIDRGERFFERHGPKAVFLGRWVSVLRIAAAWLAGVHRMRWRTFVFWNALGAIAWATSIGLLAYFLGALAGRALAGLGALGVTTAILLLAALLLWRRRTVEKAARASGK